MRIFLRPRRETIGPEECPLIYRWTLAEFGRPTPDPGRPDETVPSAAKFLLHRFLPNADDRHLHDHPRPFLTLVLRGGYDDLVECPACEGTGRTVLGRAGVGRVPFWCDACDAQGTGSGLVVGDRMRPGMLRRRRAHYRHRTRALPRGAWTLVLMGPLRREWGFWVEGRWLPWRRYAEEFGDGMRCP